MSIQLIAQRSEQVGKLLYYPCVTIFLMALAIPFGGTGGLLLLEQLLG